MQDYYNTIPAFGVGGLIAKIAKAAGRAKIQGHANLLSKVQPELSKLLSKLAKSQQGGPKLSDKEAERLATLAQNYRRSNIHYQNRRNKINEQIISKRKSAQQGAQEVTQKGTQQSTSATQSARSPYLNGSNLSYTVPPSPRASKIRNARNKKAAQQNQAQNQAQGNPSREVTSANPVPGTTLSGRWKQFRNWMDNHPKTTIGVPIFAASGIGRDILGGAWSAYNSHPFSSDSEEKKQKSVVTIDGVDIPIIMGSNGKFVVDTTGSKKPKKTPEDDIDSLIDAAAATSNVANTLPSDPSSNISVSDQSQQMINDLFDDDQW